MILLAHSEGGHGWGGPFEPWEVHPALNHLPIALLFGAVALDLYAWWRARPGLAQVATGMLIAGLLSGVLTALAGLLAFFTVSAHTEEAHELMYWHIAIQVTALLIFACPALERWRNWAATPSLAGRLAGCLATLLLMVGSGIGGYIVYHGGAGVSPELLSPLAMKHGHEDYHQEVGKQKDAPKEHVHKKDSARSDRTEQQEPHKKHDRKDEDTHKDKHAEKERDIHKEHERKDKEAQKDKHAQKEPDAHMEHKKKDEHPHKEHASKEKVVLPEVPPASASAAYAANGYHVQIVLQDLNYPSSLEFDDKGNLYVAEAGYDLADAKTAPRIIRLQLAGQIETVVSEGLEGPVTDLLWHNGKLYISHGGKISMWADKEKLVHLMTGLLKPGNHYAKQTKAVGPDGKLYFWQGHQVTRIDPKTHQAETFFGRRQDSHVRPSKEKGHGEGELKGDPKHDATRPMEKKAHEHGTKEVKDGGHKNHTKSSNEKQGPKDDQHARDDDYQQMRDDEATPGPRRLMDLRFWPGGNAVYVVDIGAAFMTPDGQHPVPRTGVVWRIISDDAAGPLLMP